jgi:hypothetical protein
VRWLCYGYRFFDLRFTDNIATGWKINHGGWRFDSLNDIGKRARLVVPRQTLPVQPTG